MHAKAPLPSCSLPHGASLAHTEPWANASVSLDSPAVEVMTDLTRVKAATIVPCAPLKQAEQYMAYLGVHMLFVVSEMPRLDGLITSTDLQSERPQLVQQSRGVRFEDLQIVDVMTPLEKIEVIAFESLGEARVSNVIATLQDRARNHLLIVDQAPRIPKRVDGVVEFDFDFDFEQNPVAPMRVRGVISRSQVERQLGRKIPVEVTARNFAEVTRMLS